MIDARSQVTNPAGRVDANGNLKLVGNVIGITIHHSVTTMSAAATQGQELAHIKAIDTGHAQNPGWGGFAYHVATFPSGRAYLCGNLNGQRAHVEARNHELIGIVAIGDFSSALPLPSHLSAIRDAIAEVRITYPGRPVRGHNDWALPGGGTTCAGRLNGLTWEDFVGADIRKEGPFTVVYNDNVPVWRFGSTDGNFPGRVSKNFGGMWLWLRMSDDALNGQKVVVFSTEEGD